MILSIFSAMYESVIGENPDYPEFRDHLFSYIGLFTFLTAAGICFIFYVMLGRWKGIWYTRAHWGITILLCAIIGYILAYTISKSELGTSDDYVVRFALFNALFAALYFIILSFVFKYFSIFSKRTPI